MSVSSTKRTLLSLSRPAKRGVVIAFDFLICGFSVWLAFGLRLDEWGYFGAKYWVVLAISIGISFPLFVSFGLYRAIFRYVGSSALATLTHVFLLYSGLFFCIFTLFGINDVPRSIGIVQPILLFLGVGGSRYFIRYWLGGFSYAQTRVHQTQPRILIYGAGSAGRQLASSLFSNKEMLVKGFIDDDSHIHGSTIDGVRVYSCFNLQDLIYQLEISDVLLAIPSVNPERRREIIESLNGCGVRVRTLPGLNDIASGRVRISDLHDLDMNDLLGREVVPPEIKLLERNISNKSVLVTGAGGSIGSELCRQIIKNSPSSLILIDSSEHALYLIYEELNREIAEFREDPLGKVDNNQNATLGVSKEIKLVPCLASVRDGDLLRNIFKAYRPNTVFHAAAYKHVPLVEQNPAEGIRNNVFGTFACAQVSLECAVSHFILVSTDKAVRPTNVMGASKRIAELVLQAMSEIAKNGNHSTVFSMVRFGNVLGSSGSVAPLFSKQIIAGGPITLTHPDVTRYFMTIPEASQLVIQAGAMASGGEVFILDMGDPVRIYDLAVRMVYLSGLLVKDEEHPHGDIEIMITGLRPGEKLYEELLIGENPQKTAHPKIMKAHEEFLSWQDLQEELEKLNLALDSGDINLIRSVLKKLVPGYQSNVNELVESEL